MAERSTDWTPQPYVSGADRPRGEGSIFDPMAAQAAQDGPRAFVTGWPVWHSRSPLIHRAWLKQFDLPGSYERVGVPPEEIGEFFRSLRRKGFVGGNVTLPHKLAAFGAVGRRNAAAEAIGAVNTLWFEKSGRLVGGNTDAYGFAANLDDCLPGWVDAGTATVLGAGGAARAVIVALLKGGIRSVRIVNRTLAHGEDLAERFGSRVSAHGEDEKQALFTSTDLLVNTTPIPAPDPDDETPEWFAPRLPDLSALPDHAMVADIVYVPLQTPILRAAAERGLRTADGLGMLLHQAVPGFERWFGRRPAVDAALRETIVRDIESGV